MFFLAGLVLEIAHIHSDDTIRGLIFFLIGILILIPGGKYLYSFCNIFFITVSCTVYAVIHIYLAAKKVGRIRFSSVWFFR